MTEAYESAEDYIALVKRRNPAFDQAVLARTDEEFSDAACLAIRSTLRDMERRRADFADWGAMSLGRELAAGLTAGMLPTSLVDSDDGLVRWLIRGPRDQQIACGCVEYTTSDDHCGTVKQLLDLVCEESCAITVAFVRRPGIASIVEELSDHYRAALECHDKVEVATGEGITWATRALHSHPRGNPVRIDHFATDQRVAVRASATSRMPARNAPPPFNMAARLHRVRILHVSDIHFPYADATSPPNRRDSVRIQRPRMGLVTGEKWRENLHEILRDGIPFDLVCVTGDIADWGIKEEYDLATPFLQELTTLLEVDASRLFLIPGNHDVHRGTEEKAWEALRAIAPKLDAGEFSAWIAGGPAPAGADPEWRGKVLSRRNAWSNWVRDSLGAAHCLPGPSNHPHLGYRHELTLAGRPFPVQIVGLDTAWLAGDDHDEGKLRVTDDQVLMNGTHEGSPLPGLRIALCHHPLQSCADGNAALRHLGDFVDIVLRGHQHEPLANVWRDPDRGLVELASGCVWESHGGHRYPNGFQIIDVFANAAGKPEVLEMRFRAWSSRSFWHDDASVYKNAAGGRLRLDLVPDAARTGQGDAGPDGTAVSVASNLKSSSSISIEDIDVQEPATTTTVASNVDAGGDLRISGVRVGRRDDDGRA